MKFYLSTCFLLFFIISCHNKTSDNNNQFLLDKSKLLNSLQQENLKGDVEYIIYKKIDYNNNIIYDNRECEYTKDGFIKKENSDYIRIDYDEYGRIQNEYFKEEIESESTQNKKYRIENNTSISEVEGDYFKYNDKGLLTCYVSEKDTTEYVYNEENKLINKIRKNFIWNEVINDKYEYNEKGDLHLIDRLINDTVGKFKNKYIYATYSYNKYDEQGNWIQRIQQQTSFDNTQLFTDKMEFEEREIKYWNNELPINIQNKTSSTSDNSIQFKGGTFKNNTNIYVIFIPQNNKGGKANMIDGQRIEKYSYDIKDNGEIYLHEGRFNNSHTGERQAVDSKTFYLEDGYIYYMSGGRKYKYHPSNDKLRDYFYY